MDWSTRLKKWADSTEDKIAQSEGFSVEVLPVYVQELLHWEFWGAVYWAVVAAVGLLFFAGVAKTLIRRLDNIKPGVDESGSAVAAAFSLVASMVCGFVLIWNCHVACKVYAAPRVVAVDKIAEMVSKATK
jgi:hypothetical protein